MAQGDNKTIHIGSAYAYVTEFTGTMPTIEEMCVGTNLLGYIKSGCHLTYTETTYTEKDDMGIVSKTITTDEEASVKLGLITYNNTTLAKLSDRSTVTEKDGVRTLKLGGANKAKGTNYAICLHHPDPVDGSVHIQIAGRNTAGISLAFSTSAGTMVEPEFKAVPQDSDGTLIVITEEYKQA